MFAAKLNKYRYILLIATVIKNGYCLCITLHEKLNKTIAIFFLSFIVVWGFKTSNEMSTSLLTTATFSRVVLTIITVFIIALIGSISTMWFFSGSGCGSGCGCSCWCSCGRWSGGSSRWSGGCGAWGCCRRCCSGRRRRSYVTQINKFVKHYRSYYDPKSFLCPLALLR